MINYHELRMLHKRPKDNGYIMEIFFISLIIFLVVMVGCAYASDNGSVGFLGASGVNVDKLADAIYRAENSKNHPYGILVKYKHTSARQACINTIKHALKDWDIAGNPGNFITFLGARYCPIGSDTDNGTCKYWAGNVRYYYSR